MLRSVLSPPAEKSLILGACLMLFRGGGCRWSRLGEVHGSERRGWAWAGRSSRGSAPEIEGGCLFVFVRPVAWTSCGCVGLLFEHTESAAAGRCAALAGLVCESWRGSAEHNLCRCRAFLPAAPGPTDAPDVPSPHGARAGCYQSTWAGTSDQTAAPGSRDAPDVRSPHGARACELRTTRRPLRRHLC